MTELRSLMKRVQRLEAGRALPRSPFVVMHGSFDAFAALVQEQIDAGQLDGIDMPIVLASLRRWETDGTWGNTPHTNGVWGRR